MVEESNRRTVVDMYAALNAGDGAAYFACMKDDVRITFYGSHRFSRTFLGKADIMQNFVRPLRERLDGSIKLHVKNVIAEGDQVVVEAEGEARTKDGLPYNNVYCIVLRMEDGKAAEVREYMDTSLTKAIFG